MALVHGGRLRQAAREYGIPLADWLDLSTGISPWSWPVPAVPESVFRRLPEADDGLAEAARGWAGAPDGAACLPLAGSQAAINALPNLRQASRVAVGAPAYAEHAHRWRLAGHTVTALTADQVDAALDEIDVLVWVHPNNPTGETLGMERLLAWHRRLAEKGGWLVIDEAFIEAAETASLVPRTGVPGLFVLRSVGKFFGLAGLRAGFCFGPSDLVGQLDEALGPWTVNGPARWLLRQALADTGWQAEQLDRLHREASRLRGLLLVAGFSPVGGTGLFVTVRCREPAEIQSALAREGILVRRFDQPPMLRFGLPGSDAAMQRLQRAIDRLPLA